MKTISILRATLKTTRIIGLRIFAYIAALFIKRDKKIILVIGRDGGKLLDNAKYTFFQITHNFENDADIYFSTKHKDLATILESHQLKPLLRKANPKWLYIYLSAGIIIVDSVDWNENGHYFLVKGASIIQLWHGIPLKEIEIIKAKKTLEGKQRITRVLIELYWMLTARYFQADILVTTSEFSTQLLKTCINAKEYLALGYPRNDALITSQLSSLYFLNVDSDAHEKINRWVEEGHKIVFYCPTFRKNLMDSFASKKENIHLLDEFSTEAGIKFIIKLHPLICSGAADKKIKNVLFLKPDSDVYPILSKADILITDYSAIAFDFLLTQKPIIYFLYDITDYNLNDRSFTLDQEKFLPGKKVFTLAALKEEISKSIAHTGDLYSHRRKEIKETLFSNYDNKSGERFCKMLFERFFNENK